MSSLRASLKLHYEKRFLQLFGINAGTKLVITNTQLVEFVDQQISFITNACRFMNDGKGALQDDVLNFFSVTQTPAEMAIDDLSSQDSQASEETESLAPTATFATPVPAASTTTTGSTNAGASGTAAADVDQSPTPESTDGAPVDPSASDSGVFDPRERGMDID